MKENNNYNFLRLGLGFVFLYAGMASFFDPELWISYVPAWVENFGVSRETILYLHAVGDIVLGLVFLSGKWRKIAGYLGFVILITIVVSSGTSLLLITFRDIGLAFASLAYAHTRKS
ncbi:MAG: DoxX family membrane protein [Candidatus Spechtbacterales bacterium]|nr:DoxX family membrane protein [Candidatus Spechtbacterales bacterium]